MYDKDILAKSTGASLGVVAIVGMLFLSSGMAFAVPLSGIGGFQVQSDTVTAEDFILYPGVADMSEKEGYPQAVNELENAEITNLNLVKELDLSKYDSISGERAAIVVTADEPVTADALLLKTPALSADRAVFSGQTIYESNTSDLNQAFTLRANGSVDKDTRLPGATIDSSQQDLSNLDNASASDTVYLENTDIQTSFLVANTLDISGLGLEVWYDETNDGTTNWDYGG